MQRLAQPPKLLQGYYQFAALGGVVVLKVGEGVDSARERDGPRDRKVDFAFCCGLGNVFEIPALVFALRTWKLLEYMLLAIFAASR